MIFTLTFSTTGDAPEITTQVIYQDQIQGEFTGDKLSSQIQFTVNDTDENTLQTIRVAMTGKNDNHTRLNSQGSIQHDSHVKIENINFNGVDVTEIFCDGCCCYSHDNNGTGEWHTEEFYGYIGCNGWVDVEFYTPLYLWVLENTNS